MSSSPRLAYVQARIQARYAQRPDASVWASLGQTEGVSRYLQQADAAGLGPWLEKLGVNSSSHAVEISVRESFRQLVREISGWMPGQWCSATRWCGLLIDLEPIRIMVSGEPSPDWFQDDPFLGTLASEPATWPLTELAPVDGNVNALGTRWRTIWRQQCPGMTARENRGLAALNALLPVVAYDKHVVAKLDRCFRNFSGGPIAVFSFLGLVLSDLLRLRGELLKRFEFSRMSS